MSKTETLNHCHVMEERGWLFHSEDSISTEEEYLYLLYALIYCLKPFKVLETGTCYGIGTAYICRALQKNGFGHVFSLEIEPQLVKKGWAQLELDGLEEWADIICTDSMEYLANTGEQFDFAFFDSLLPLRTKELKICLERKLLKSGTIFAMHDTSRLRTITPGSPDPQTPIHWKKFEAIEGIRWIEFPLSRGLTLGQVI